MSRRVCIFGIFPVKGIGLKSYIGPQKVRVVPEQVFQNQEGFIPVCGFIAFHCC
ncbi:hypothetical protein DSECCO2_584750 [anaerobic digester metagenome]